MASLWLDLIPDKEEPNQVSPQLVDLQHKNVCFDSQMTVEWSCTMPCGILSNVNTPYFFSCFQSVIPFIETYFLQFRYRLCKTNVLKTAEFPKVAAGTGIDEIQEQLVIYFHTFNSFHLCICFLKMLALSIGLYFQPYFIILVSRDSSGYVNKFHHISSGLSS